jgi:hypothetical protein
MSTSTLFPRLSALLFAGTFILLGCDPTESQNPIEKRDQAKPVETRKVEVGKNVSLEVQGDRRRVLVHASVCLQRGPLELLMCRKQTKEHESILTADVDARDIHKGLLLTKATPGAPCQYLEDRIKPATGTTVKISLQYEKKGKLLTVSAGEWVRNVKTQKELKEDWVFAGSRFAKNVFDPKKPDLYLANEGDVICISNFEDAMLDLPIPSPKDDADRAFEANTDKIPDLETKVVVILEPILDGKKPKK